jgi:hypothetical protein
MNLRWIDWTGVLATIWALCLSVAPAGEPPAAPNFIVIDDFENYTDDEEALRIYEAWIDGWAAGSDRLGNGTGSFIGDGWAPFAHVPIVHGGKQAMCFDYDNADPPQHCELMISESSGQRPSGGFEGKSVKHHLRAEVLSDERVASGFTVAAKGGRP